MRVIIEPDYQKLSQWAANYVASKINAANPTPEKPFVLGCPTGSSPSSLSRYVQSADRTEQTRKSIFPERCYFQHGRICRFTRRPS